MALKQVGYIGDSNVKVNSPSTVIKSGTVYRGINPTEAGYPGSQGTSGGYILPAGKGGSLGSWYKSQTESTAPKTTTGSVKSGGSSSGASSSSNTANAYNALLAAYKQNDYSDYLRQMREAAQNAYDRGMNALNSAYDNQLNSLSSNLSETRNQLANQYNRSMGNINRDAEGSLRQAYINKMMSQKNLGQQMSALGLNGGATESTLANMANNYGNARNNINVTRNNNLSELEGNYSDNLSQAQQAYNSAVATANLQRAQQAMQLENALANNQISALGDYQSLMQRENQNYLDLLKAAIANGASFQWNPTEANNAYVAQNIQQAASPDYVNNLTALQNLMGAENVPGVTMPGATVVSAPTQGNTLADFLARLARG